MRTALCLLAVCLCVAACSSGGGRSLEGALSRDAGVAGSDATAIDATRDAGPADASLEVRAAGILLEANWIGSCYPSPVCWTGPDFEPALAIAAGEADVWIAIENGGFEGSTVSLPIAGSGSTSFESWGVGASCWSRPSPFRRRGR
jgi:hypothetical protein